MYNICEKIIFHCPILGQIIRNFYLIFRKQPSPEIKQNKRNQADFK